MPPVSLYSKAVILGAAGFIGINLADALVAEGFEVVCFDRSPSPHWPEAALKISGDFSSLPVEILRQVDHSLVFHLISSNRPSPRTDQAADEVSNDLVSTIHWLEATKRSDVRWVFFSSGGTIYGNKDNERIAESSLPNPVCSYGVLKLAIERYFALYRVLHNLDFVVVRLANPYGPWQYPLRGQGLIANMLYKALKGEVIEIWGDGENIRDYIYITDAVNGVLAAARLGMPGEIYNIGTARGLSIKQLVAIIGQTMDIRIDVKYLPARQIDVRKNVLDAAKLRAHTGWEPKTTLQSGLTSTAAWMNAVVNV